MKAMVLAAGLGTRLRPLTDRRPKALVEVAGRTLLEITLTRLRSFGVREAIVNVHHFADMVIDCLKAHADFGMKVEVSREDVLLDTGGGLKKAAWFFSENGRDEPFIVHNVDVISTIDLARMVEFHKEHAAVATLAMQQRKSSRYLLFDERGELCGRRVGGQDEIARASADVQPLAFCGIHVISPRMLPMMNEDGVFSIIESYLHIAARGERIGTFSADEYHWRDLGKPESLREAEREMEHQVL